MSARDDYPWNWLDRHVWEQMCDEIDKLRRWKDDGITVLGQWARVYIALDRENLGGVAGENMSDVVLRFVERAIIERAAVHAALDQYNAEPGPIIGIAAITGMAAIAKAAGR